MNTCKTGNKMVYFNLTIPIILLNMNDFNTQDNWGLLVWGKARPNSRLSIRNLL